MWFKLFYLWNYRSSHANERFVCVSECVRVCVQLFSELKFIRVEFSIFFSVSMLVQHFFHLCKNVGIITNNLMMDKI